MNKTIYLKYPWKTKDMVEGYKYHLKGSSLHRILKIFLLVIGIFTLGSGLLVILFKSFNSNSLFSIFIGLYCLFNYQITTFFFEQNLRKLNYENKQVEWEISEDKIVSRMINLSESILNWEIIIGIIDTPKGFLLYHQQTLFFWLPKKRFENDEDIAQLAFMAQDKVKNWQQIK